MTEMPKTIKVGYRDYVVEEWSPRDASAADRSGECDRLNGVIRIRTDVQPQFVAQVLWHEVLHAAYDMGDLDTSDEEKIVTVLANQTMQIFRDNPDLLAFINGATK